MNSFSSLFFGTRPEGPFTPTLRDGNRAVGVVIEGQTLQVDLDALAEVSGVFMQVQSQQTSEVPLANFPGGLAVFQQLVDFLMNPKEQGTFQVTEGNVLQLFEAAWMLECPCVFDEIMESSYMRSLSSRRKVDLLERLLPYTAVSSPLEGFAKEQSISDDSLPIDEFMRTFLLETKLWQRSEHAAVELCAQLDTNDFVLGPRLATGSLRVSCEILRLHQRRDEEAGFVSSALLPVTALWKNLTDKPLKAKVSWDAHLFALHCMRQRLVDDEKSDVSAPALPEDRQDLQAKADLADEHCDSVEDSKLLSLAELVNYVDIQRLPTNWACLLVRTLLLSGRTEEARQAFAVAFPTGPKVQRLAWKQPTVVPVVWLADVAEHVEAARGLLRVLSGFREMEGNDLCDIIEDVLLAKFLPLPHCSPLVLASELVNDIVGACLEAGQKARAPRKESTQGDLAQAAAAAVQQSRCPAHWSGQHVLWRLHHVGIRLFEAAFVPQQGFMPHSWPGSFRDAQDRLPCCAEEPACQPEPLIIQVAGTCLWDEDLLKIELLRAIMDRGRAAPGQPILHYGRQVIMRHLWYGHRNTYCNVQRLAVLWDLACWPLCEDAGLIREALEYLKGTYRELHASGATWNPESEELIFRMFAALDLSRLPGQALLSPWVPPQVQMVRLLVQHQPSEQFHADLQHEVSSANGSLKSINQQCLKLTNKLNIVEQRTMINKSQINDAIVAIEEHQRRKCEAALPRARSKELT